MKQFLIMIFILFTATSNAADVKVIIDVESMTCPLCVTVVNQVLRQTDGVIKAKSSLKTRQAVAVVPEEFDVNQLVRAISKTGYTGKINRVEQIQE